MCFILGEESDEEEEEQFDQDEDNFSDELELTRGNKHSFSVLNSFSTYFQLMSTYPTTSLLNTFFHSHYMAYTRQTG